MNEFPSKSSSFSKHNHTRSSMNITRSTNTRNSGQFSHQNQTNSGYLNTQKNNMNSSQVSESQNEQSFKGNIYFMKFEHFLKEFNSFYMLKIYNRNEDMEETRPEMSENEQRLEQKSWGTKKNHHWKCYVFESYWKGKRMGGPKVDLEKTYVSNLKSRFKKGMS